MSSSVGMIIPNIWKNKKMFQTTDQFSSSVQEYFTIVAEEECSRESKSLWEWYEQEPK